MQKWIKKGVIFDSRNAKLKTSHTTIPFADRVKRNIYRIYFSGRDDQNRSFTSFFEININQIDQIINQSSTPLLTHGFLGTFDESGAMGSWITTSGRKKFLFYIGWNLAKTIPFRNAVGLAISHDNGTTFKKYSPGPILDRSIFDPCFTASPCVLIDDKQWRMWYLSGIKWEKTGKSLRHYYHIKYAESDDGVNWKRSGRVCIDFNSKDEYAISRPCVIKESNIYKMWYSYRGKKYKIGYAESLDGNKWIRKDDEVGIDTSEKGWDSEMICYPFVFKNNKKTYMLYNGNGYGRSGIGLAILDTNH